MVKYRTATDCAKADVNKDTVASTAPAMVTDLHPNLFTNDPEIGPEKNNKKLNMVLYWNIMINGINSKLE